MTNPMTTDRLTLEQAERRTDVSAANRERAPTKASWEAFLAQRKALYEAQLKAMRPAKRL
jgi:hypothetical protein